MGDDTHLSNQEAKFRVEEGDSRVSSIRLGVRNSLKESFSLSVESRGGSRSPGEQERNNGVPVFGKRQTREPRSCRRASLLSAWKNAGRNNQTNYL